MHRITFTIRGATKENDPCYVLLRSDAHHDNPHSDNELEEKHLKEALERDAPIIDNGDAFCAMQGRWDKRSCKDDLKPEHQVENYLDALVSTYADFLKPYASQFAVVAQGNHETAIRRHHETCLTTRLIERLRMASGKAIFDGMYTGWVIISVKRLSANGKEKKSNNKATRPALRTLRIWRTHGYGGAAPVTKGTIQTNRRAVYVPDANIIMSGHTHQEWFFPIQRMRISSKGKVYQDEQLHISLPSYKDGFGIGEKGWEVEKGFPPAPRGAVWLKLKWVGDDIVWDFERAK